MKNIKLSISNRKYALILMPDVELVRKYVRTEIPENVVWNADNIVCEVDAEWLSDHYRAYFCIKIDDNTSFRIYQECFIASQAELIGTTPIDDAVWQEILATFTEKQRSHIDTKRKYLVFKITDYNGIKRFLVDPTNFKGYSKDTMSDGVHGDYGLGHSTLEEYKRMLSNHALKLVTREELEAMEEEYIISLCKPFEEISEQRYNEYFNCLPPLRMRKNSFFISEEYWGNLHLFLFTVDGRYYSGLRNVRTPDAELNKEINEFLKKQE